MKKSFISVVLLGCVASVSGAIWQFDLGPIGLNGLNERPQVITTATGGEIAPGISYNDSTKQLTLNFAYGTDHGFTDLSSSLNQGGAHIHGPVVNNPIPTEGTAGVLYSIFSLINQTSSTAGVASGVVQFVDLQAGAYPIAAQEADLFAGKYYVNLHTAAFGGGEIRGQLLLVPEPETYGMIAGLALLGFAGWRRMRVKAA